MVISGAGGASHFEVTSVKVVCKLHLGHDVGSAELGGADHPWPVVKPGNGSPWMSDDMLKVAL